MTTRIDPAPWERARLLRPGIEEDSLLRLSLPDRRVREKIAHWTERVERNIRIGTDAAGDFFITNVDRYGEWIRGWDRNSPHFGPRGHTLAEAWGKFLVEFARLRLLGKL